MTQRKRALRCGGSVSPPPLGCCVLVGPSCGTSAALGRPGTGAGLSPEDRLQFSAAQASAQTSAVLSPLVGVCQPRLSPQPSSGGSGFWCHHIVTSCSLLCFQKTPGPGAYTASAQFPKQPRTIAKMGREHSLFFNNTIGF